MAAEKKAKKEDKPAEDKLKDEASRGGKEAEDREGAAPAPAAAGRLSRFPLKKLALFVGLPLLLLIGAGTGAYFMGLFSEEPLNCESVKEGDKRFAACAALQEAAEAGRPAAFLDIPDMIVNLNTPGKQPRFLKISLKLELEGAEDQVKMEPLLPRVVDQFQMYLRELRIEDLRGTSGVYRLKIELLSRVRAAAPNVKVRDVLFQEILVQ